VSSFFNTDERIVGKFQKKSKEKKIKNHLRAELVVIS